MQLHYTISISVASAHPAGHSDIHRGRKQRRGAARQVSGSAEKPPAGIRRDEATKPETREYSKVGTTSIVPKSERKQSDNEVFLGRKPSATIIGERIRDRGGYRRRIGSASRSQGKLAGNRDQ